MSVILIQQSHDAQYSRIVEIIGEAFTVLEASDDDLKSLIEQHQSDIAGFIVFRLNEKTTIASDLLTNERFNAPATPILCFGHLGPYTHLPYGMQLIDPGKSTQILEILQKPREISILVVEDDEAIMDVLTITLSKYFDVHPSIDGTTAIQCLSQQMYDLVVLDLMLPGDHSGEEVFKYIKSHHPNMPVVIITAYDTKQRELEYSFSGADAYIPKPWSSNEEFRQLLMKAIKTRHAKITTQAQLSSNLNTGEKHDQYMERMRSYT